ncbi:ANTAR domain-containing protein [Shewanella sp. KX20019]|uniref:ANTAR domain-containing response regulator n=1 Tax=Shewanella sp. KX20019 TaxID=2803864 RepID=UPI00192974EF|nr:ANTAR domain-containing protein [Shewanella sp. KX20019]QQX82092.1 ANTAR domain-containing protein [Shewanella sp. KX20019]
MRILTLFEFTDYEPLLNQVTKCNFELVKLDSLSAFERFSLKTDSDIVLLCVESITAIHVKFIERLMQFAPLPLIITSKSAERLDIAALLHCGRVTYIPQQFDFERLDNIIQLALIRFTTATQLLSKLAELEQCLQDQKLVDIAKQQLQQSGLSESDAHTALQQQAMSSGRSLASIAAILCHNR